MAYDKNFLSPITFSINYQDVEELKNTLTDELRILCERKAASPLQILQINNLTFSASGSTVNSIAKQWAFNVGAEIKIVLTYNSLLIQNFKYTDHTSFHSLIKDIYTKLTETYSIKPRRIALRYTNKINLATGGAFDFESLINDSLVKPTLEFKEEHLRRSFGYIEMKNPEDSIGLNFYYGFFNPEYPNLIAKREYLLDYDCYYDIGIDEPLDIISKLLALRQKVNKYFEKSIKDELRTQHLTNA